jgi:putative effector of murein hydrolase LrgA (UPF0299 family)
VKIASRLAIYGISGALSGSLGAGLFFLLEVYFLRFLDSPFSFMEHCVYWSPLDQHFWRAANQMMGFFFGAPVSGALLGILTGCFGATWKKWGEVRCCALLWAFVYVVPTLVLMFSPALVLILIEQKPMRAEFAPIAVMLTVGMVCGAVLGFSVRLLGLWWEKVTASYVDASLEG